MIEFIENIRNKIYFLFNKIIVYNTESKKKKNIRIIKNINYNNEEMYGQFIYFD